MSSFTHHFVPNLYDYLQWNILWGQKVFSQPLIVQVLLLRIMREVIFITGTL